MSQNLFILALVVIQCSCVNSSVDNHVCIPHTTKQHANANVIHWTKSLIDSLATSIDSSKMFFDAVQKDADCFSTEGSNLIGYFKDFEIQKLEVNNYGEMGKSFEQYYFHNKEAFYACVITYNYNIPFYENGSAIKDSTLTKAYLPLDVGEKKQDLIVLIEKYLDIFDD